MNTKGRIIKRRIRRPVVWRLGSFGIIITGFNSLFFIYPPFASIRATCEPLAIRAPRRPPGGRVGYAVNRPYETYFGPFFGRDEVYGIFVGVLASDGQPIAVRGPFRVETLRNVNLIFGFNIYRPYHVSLASVEILGEDDATAIGGPAGVVELAARR